MPPAEVLAHRVLWSLLLTGLAVALAGRAGQAWAVVETGKLRWFLLSALMISINWLLFIWSVVNGRALEASMGYYLYPLVSVLLGALVLREGLGRRQMAAVGVVAAGVAWLVAAQGALPWVALTLATTFGTYGLLRKTAPAESLVGLFLETLVLAPLALAWLALAPERPGGAFLAGDGATAGMLALAGPVTTLPLLLFAFAARRLKLSTLGLMQYLNPTVQMLVATLAFGEAFTPTHLVTFLCIWSGLLIYSLDPRAVLGTLTGRPRPPHIQPSPQAGTTLPDDLGKGRP